MSRRRKSRRRFVTGVWTTISEPGDDVTAIRVLLAELTAESIECGFRGGEFYWGGRYHPSSDQELRLMRLGHLVPALAPWIVPVEWPRQNGVLWDLRSYYAGRPVCLDRPTYTTHRQVVPPQFLSEWGWL